MSSLRDRQRSATRSAIVGAYLELTHAGTEAVSMQDVAAEAGVSVRTLYRYFATRAELHEAAANHYNDRVRQRIDADVTVGNFAEYLTELWTDFQAELPAVIAEHATPTGRELRATRLESSRRTVREALVANGWRAETIDDDVVDLIVALTSSSMFLELVERMGHEPDRAVAMVARAARLLIDDSRADRPTPPSRASTPTGQQENER